MMKLLYKIINSSLILFEQHFIEYYMADILFNRKIDSYLEYHNNIGESC